MEAANPLEHRREIVRLAKAERDRRTPYVYGAQKLGRGVDCSGLCVAIWRHLGLVRPNYDDTAHGLYHSFPACRLNQLHGGDLVFFARGSSHPDGPGYRVGHVAIYTGSGPHGEPYIIHAAGGGPGVVSAAIARIKRAHVKQQSLFCRRDLIGLASIDRLLQ